MSRNLEVPEVCKFEAMLGWARHKIRTKTSSKMDAKLEFRCTMERLSRDLKLYRISPQDLIKVYQLHFNVVCYCHSDRTLKQFRHCHVTVTFSTEMYILTLQVSSVKIFYVHKILYFSQHVTFVGILSELQKSRNIWGNFLPYI